MQITESSILNAFIDGILVVSPEGKINYFNSRFIELWEIPDDVISAKLDEDSLKFIESKLYDPSAFFDRVSYLYANPSEKSFDEVILKDGRTFDRYSAPITDDNQLFIGRIWFFRDITHQKQVELTVAHQQKIIARSARMSALGEMAGGIAHEINNPLSIIHAHAEMLLDADIEKLTTPVLQKTATKIKETSKRIAHIINGLRIFSRNGDKDPFVPIVLENVIEDTMAICIEKFKTKSIKITFENPEKKIQVEGRATQLMQVFLNLLNNAADAIEPLSEKWIQVKMKKDHNMVEVSVIDSGYGIDSFIAEKIFQPFFTTKPPGKGTGLGLSISKGIVEDHEGQLFINKQFHNTCFMIRLPLFQNQQKDKL